MKKQAMAESPPNNKGIVAHWGFPCSESHKPKNEKIAEMMPKTTNRLNMVDFLVFLIAG